MEIGIDQIVLLATIGIPFLASLVLFCGFVASDADVKRLGCLAFILPFAGSLWVFLRFDYGIEAGNQFSVLFERVGLQQFGIMFHLGLNGVSTPLFLMTGIVGLAGGWTAICSRTDRLRLYLALLTLMHSGLLGFFASVDLFFFFLFHEFALVPSFVMIGLWGGRDRRGAAMKLLIYLLVGALLTLGGLVALNVYAEADRFDFPTLSLALSEMVADGEFGEVTQFRIFGLLLFGFGILVALFPFHTWVPRAYAAAPSSLAMLHAGVLKKFGLYGLAQVALPLLPLGALQWSSWLIWLALGNILIVGFVALAQTNLRKMIGYASVMHVGYCFLGIGVLTALGVGSTVMLMVAHGLSVALMFLLSKYIDQRCGTFEMDKMGGLATKTPILACLFVGGCFAMIGLPGFGNFWGEFGIFMALGEIPETRFALGLASFGIVISAIFGLRAVAKVLFGEQTDAFLAAEKDQAVKDLEITEIAPAVLLLGSLLLIGFWPRSISDSVDNELMSPKRYLVSQAGNAFGLPSCCASGVSSALANDANVTTDFNGSIGISKDFPESNTTNE